MKYNILLTQEENLINAFVLGLPTCNVKTRSRNEAIALIRKNLMSVLKQSEIIQIEVPNKPYNIIYPIIYQIKKLHGTIMVMVLLKKIQIGTKYLMKSKLIVMTI